MGRKAEARAEAFFVINNKYKAREKILAIKPLHTQELPDKAEFTLHEVRKVDCNYNGCDKAHHIQVMSLCFKFLGRVSLTNGTTFDCHACNGKGYDTSQPRSTYAFGDEGDYKKAWLMKKHGPCPICAATLKTAERWIVLCDTSEMMRCPTCLKPIPILHTGLKYCHKKDEYTHVIDAFYKVF